MCQYKFFLEEKERENVIVRSEAEIKEKHKAKKDSIDCKKS